MIYQVSHQVDWLFPGAALYRQRFFSDAVQETSGRWFPYSERHLHALWFDDSLRPSLLKTSCGEVVVVESPGRWNLEAGPDFHGAVLLVGREGRRVAGDAEIHIFSRDWKNHGHHIDARYEGVRFHITWFPEPADDALFPPGTVHISLANACIVDLESIDLTAYPYEEPRASDAFPMVEKCPNEIIQTLEHAGQERVRQKTQRMAWLMSERGEAQALYEETAAALGYKKNKAPFRLLAQRVELSALASYGDDWETIYAVLLGLSGLLPRQPGPAWSAEAKAYFRSLWDCWWRDEQKWSEVEPLARADWNFAGLRPLNHPVRRLCALAQWVGNGHFQSVEGSGVPQCGCFQGLEPSFWSTHVGWSGAAKNAELIGKGRLDALELNVLVPFRLAKGDSTALDGLHVEPMNSVIRETAYMLFGPDHSPKLYRSALARQGLIQIYNDFILTGRFGELCL